MKKQTDNLTIGKCKNCHRIWRVSQLREFNFKVPCGDGFNIRKDFLCLDCYNKIDFGLKSQKTQVEKDL